MRTRTIYPRDLYGTAGKLIGMGTFGSNRIGLVAIDVDGTLLDTHHAAVPENVAALADAVRAGIVVVLASSRAPMALRSVLAHHPSMYGPAIACQGAMIGRASPDGEWLMLEEHPLELLTARKVLDVAVQYGATVNWYARSEWFVHAMTSAAIEEARIVGFRPSVVNLAALTARPHKILLLCDANAQSACVAELSTLDLSVEVSKSGYVEIVARGVDKGRALHQLAVSLGLAPCEVAAIGDGENDISMFRVAGTAIAMGNAAPKVASAASYVCPTNDEAGVADALRRWVL